MFVSYLFVPPATAARAAKNAAAVAATPPTTIASVVNIQSGSSMLSERSFERECARCCVFRGDGEQSLSGKDFGALRDCRDVTPAKLRAARRPNGCGRAALRPPARVGGDLGAWLPFTGARALTA